MVLVPVPVPVLIHNAVRPYAVINPVTAVVSIFGTKAVVVTGTRTDVGK